jgi:hypothetical protein
VGKQRPEAALRHVRDALRLVHAKNLQIMTDIMAYLSALPITFTTRSKR